jgi:hypothetical protein
MRGRRTSVVAGLLVVVLSVLGFGAARAAVTGTDKLYTLDGDFDQGTLVNVNHDVVHDQLQLNEETSTFPFVWISLSQRCTIAKVSTQSGAILAEYRTIADSASSGCRESSRTTVGLDGSVWVGHRGPGGATHVGLAEVNQCIDRNGNGKIDTSTGYGDVKAWPGSVSNVSQAADECIIHHVDTDSAPVSFSDTRHMSIDANNNLWIGTFGGSRFIKVNGSTGAIETQTPFDFNCGGYGGLIDGNGVIWSANGGSPGLLRWDPNAPASATNPRCITQNAQGQSFGVYGLAVDSDNSIWLTTFGTQVYKISPDGNTIEGPFLHGSNSAQGLAVAPNGDVWVSSALGCSGDGCTVGHLKNDGTFVGNVPNPTGAGSTGVAVDSAGKIWTANRSDNTATRIDPNGGPLGADGTTRVGAVDLTVDFPAGPDNRPLPFPYNYSDMTGAQLLSSTAPQGSWTVTQDGGSAGFKWGEAVWTHQTPAGATVLVEARAADSEAGLGSVEYAAVTNDTPFTMTGRFIQVRVTLRPGQDNASPVLQDIRICGGSGCSSAPAAQPAASGGVQGQQARSCGSKRRILMTLRIEKELRKLKASKSAVKSVRVVVNGKRAKVFKRGGRWRARADLRRLKKGRYVVRITVTLKNGKQLTGVRRYRTCRDAIAGGPPRL